MATTQTAEAITLADIQARGRELQRRFRNAGIPQYTRWMAEHNSTIKAEPSIAGRVRKLFNGDGSRRDVPLLILCEEMADKHLPQQAA